MAPISGERGKKGAERVSEGFLLIDWFAGVCTDFLGFIRVLGASYGFGGNKRQQLDRTRGQTTTKQTQIVVDKKTERQQQNNKHNNDDDNS